MEKVSYIKSLDGIELDQLRIDKTFGAIYKIVAIESSGYCIVRSVNVQQTYRIWCDNVHNWKVLGKD